jgi:dCMP deaminase
MIIGVTGGYAAGKDTVAAILGENGFMHISLSDMIRKELLQHKTSETRSSLIAMGNKLRQSFGNGVLALRAVFEMEQYRNYVVTSIRHPDEINVLRNTARFVLVWADAPQNVRFERISGRKRKGEKQVSFEEFCANEQKEMHGTGSGQQLAMCRKMADIVLVNNSTPAELRKKIEKMLADLKPQHKYVRPSWDDYFLHLVRAIARRATCDRGMSGCVITRDKHILATGYVGAPAGLPSCDEVGHLFQEVRKEDGSVSKHCIRTTHAEQNAIVHAAKMGVSIKGATLYCTMTPCAVCAKLLINAGIVRVVCERDYHASQLSKEMLGQAKIPLEIHDLRLMNYSGQKLQR